MAVALTKLAPTVVRFALAAVFIYAGAMKIWDFKAGGSATQQFAGDLQNFQLTSYWTPLILIALYLPWLEVAAGCALLVRRGEIGALVILGALTLIFIAALVSAWARGLDISCGCFGKENNATNFPLHFAEDASILAGVAFLLRTGIRQPADAA